jgi:hypothetical protein
MRALPPHDRQWSGVLDRCAAVRGNREPHLLCHQGGLPRHDWIHLPGDRTPPEMLGSLRHLERSKDIQRLIFHQPNGTFVAERVAE